MNEDSILYKYRPWDDKARRMLEEGEVFFASPDRLNDPYDCRVLPVISDESIPYLKSNSPEKFARMADEQIAGEVLKGGQPRWVPEEWLKPIDKSIGIFSLSGSPTIALMWAHYGFNHRGVCFGFSKNELGDLARKIGSDSLSSGGGVVFVEGKVEYTEEYPRLVFGSDSWIDPDVRTKIRFCTKSSHWSYEDEYRFIMTRISGSAAPIATELETQERKHYVAPGTLKQVVIGMRCSDSHIREIQDLVSGLEPIPNVFRIERFDDTYDLRLIG